ncbi:hypothetical protein RJ639_018180 [Escallonia herrerae]|uniref:Calmodulin-binding domain-containing protein n=1 Tax=Escallonia herrerae TaxID=1293975 RepID=A0AA88V9E9_9ASTE|nr:hypothetical protein RJ639_018180 [Escallonia herrerae]
MALVSSFSQNLDGRNRGGTEQRKIKKLRSIKLPKVSSTKPSRRRETLQLDWTPTGLSSADSSLKQSDQKKESSQGGSDSEDTLLSSSTASPMSSLNENIGITGGSQRKKLLQKSKSKKLASLGSFRPSRRHVKSRFDRTSIVLPNDIVTRQHQPFVEESDKSSHVLKANTSSGGRKAHFQASPRNSESSLEYSEHSSTGSSYSQSNSASRISQKPLQTSSRTSSLGNGKMLKTKTSFKAKRPSLQKSSGISQDQSIERATCASTLKDLKFPEEVEVHPGESESAKISVMKVCPYHHCSLNGHCHDPALPSKPFMYRRRRSLRTQKSMRPRNLPTVAAKRPVEKNKKFQLGKAEFHVDHVEYAHASIDTSPLGNEDMDFLEGRDEKPKGGSYSGASKVNEDAFLARKPNNKVSTCIKKGPRMNFELRGDEKPNTTTGSTAKYVGGAGEDSSGASSASKSQPFDKLGVPSEGKNGHFEQEIGSVNASIVEGSGPRGPSPVADPKANATGHEAYRPRFKKANHISMWHMIHQHMVSGLATEDGSQAIQEADKEKQVEVANMMHPTKASGSNVDVSDSATVADKHDAANQEIELRKMFAIKLVREAIEKILLPEVQDQASDTQSTTSEVISDQVPLEKNDGEGAQETISTPAESTEYNPREGDISKAADDASLDAKGVSQLTKSTSAPEEEKATKVANKSNKQAPKSWSYLKKFILLRRFIKELEKVKKFNPRKPQYVHSEPEPEAEKVRLRHQMIGEKKNSEEWMLDYALRLVVSELAPSQKRKVALLVKAFETVAPADEDQYIQVKVSKLGGSNQECRSKGEVNLSISDANDTYEKTEINVASNRYHGDNQYTNAHEQSDVSTLCTPTAKDSLLHDKQKSDDIRSCEKVPGDEKAREDQENMISNLDSQSSLGGSALSSKSEEFDCDKLKQATTDNEDNRESKPADVVLREIPPLIALKPDCTANEPQKSQLDKQNHIRMWHMIYHHVVSGIAAKVGNQLLLDGQVNDANKENLDASHQKIEFSPSVALKLVQEEVDEILFPEIQDDSSDAQSTASDIAPDPELLEKCEGDSGTRGVEAADSLEEEKGTAAETVTSPEEERVATSLVINKYVQQKSKNWNKLKKLILLKRSIKALETFRKLNSRPPEQLPLARDPEAEKVDLRRQMMDERKKAEQWMLDYAVQHIVTKLTPARKRRVAMLVEAFEAVVPLPEF